MEKAREHWNRIWEQSGDFDENVVFQCVVDSIMDNMGQNMKGLKILEAGAGTGTTSLHLAKQGAIPTLVDYSPVAIEKMKDMFDHNAISATFICEDIRNISVRGNSYDLVFNSGVLEHFPYEEQVKILLEMKRICKPTGKVMLFTPNAKCLFYRLFKWLCEINNVWRWGPEEPVVSMERQFKDAGLIISREYSIGFLDSLEHLAAIKGTEFLVAVLREFYHHLSPEEKNLFEGYLVCSVGIKRTNRNQRANKKQR